MRTIGKSCYFQPPTATGSVNRTIYLLRHVGVEKNHDESIGNLKMPRFHITKGKLRENVGAGKVVS